MTWAEIFFTSEWLIRIAALFYFVPRMQPAAARAWLLSFFFLPWPALILFLIIGRRTLPHVHQQANELLSEYVRTAQSRQPVSHAIVTPDLPQSLDAVPKLAEKLGEFPVTGGNQIELLSDYTLSHNTLLADIRAARHHVHLMTYIFAADTTGERFHIALREAVSRGVRCRVLMDKLGSGRKAAATVARLRADGIEAILTMPSRLFRPRSGRLDLRNHRKIAVIDGRIGYFGSQNVIDAEVWKGHPNVELTARVRGPLVRELQLVFMADRFAECGTHLDEAELFPAEEAPGSTAAQALPSGPAYRNENNLEVIVAALHGSRREVVLTTPYFIPPEPLAEALWSAAQRGVRVRLILPRWSNSLLESLAEHSYYQGLLEAGIEIHRYWPRFLHAKHISVDDDLAIIGSTNLDLRSFLLNAEVVALIYGRSVVQDLRRVEADYLQHSEQLTLEMWRARPRIQRMGESLCRLMDTLL